MLEYVACGGFTVVKRSKEESEFRKANQYEGRGSMDSFFKIKERNSSVTDEVIGGLTTFLAMAYIIAVNPAMMEVAGIPFGAALTATCLGAAVMTIAMGLIANRPIALASGMGINAIVAYTLCLGEVGVDWRVAMSVIFLEGIVILILVLCGLESSPSAMNVD